MVNLLNNQQGLVRDPTSASRTEQIGLADWISRNGLKIFYAA